MQNVLQLQVYLEIFQHHSGHICPKRVKKVATIKLFKPLKPIVKLDFFRHKVALLWTIKFPASELKTALFGNFRILFQSIVWIIFGWLVFARSRLNTFLSTDDKEQNFLYVKNVEERERVGVRESGRVCVRVCACAWKREREFRLLLFIPANILWYFFTCSVHRRTNWKKKSYPKQHPDPILWRKLRLRNYFLNFWSPVVENGQLASN